MSQKYQYEALPSNGWIRLLTVDPGSGPLRCSLEAVELKICESSFDAISYAWTPHQEARREDIDCGSSSLTVSSNLARALERVRHDDEHRTIWADAACINQEDDEERACQVQQMAEIFTAARNVLVWVGTVDLEEAELCFNLIRMVNDYSRQLLVQYGTVEKIPAGLYATKLHCILPQTWASVRRMMDNSWFTRVWAIQEVGLARKATLMYGDAEMDWIELVEYMMFVADRQDLSALAGDIHSGMIWDVYEEVWRTYTNPVSWRNKISHAALFSDLPTALSFLSVVNVIRPYKSSDPRDRLYALLGHPSAIQPGSRGGKIVDVDYGITIPALYTQLAARSIVHAQTPWLALTCVDHADNPDDLAARCPSWVPQWHDDWRVYWLGYPSMWYRAGGHEGNSFSGSVDQSNGLHLQVIIFDRICWTSEPLHSTVIQAPRCSSSDPIATIWTELQGVRGRPRYGGISEDETAFSLVTVAGRAPDEGPADRSIEVHRRTYNASRSYQPSAELSDSAKLEVRSLIRNQARALHNRRLFRTDSGYYGICHNFVRPGDVCAVIPGVNVPIVFRKVPQKIESSVGLPCFHLVGEAFIQGIMHGELFESPSGDHASFEQEVVIV